MFSLNEAIFNLEMIFNVFFKSLNDCGYLVFSHFLFHILVSGLMSDGKGQTQACVLIDGTTSVLAAHSTNGGKTCKRKAVSKERCISKYTGRMIKHMVPIRKCP